MPKILGRALKAAKKGELVEVEFDSGYGNETYIQALPDEPPSVAILRLEIENELRSKLNAANLEVQRLRTRVKTLEKVIQEDQWGNEDFVQKVCDGVANRITYRFSRMIVNGIQGYDY